MVLTFCKSLSSLLLVLMLVACGSHLQPSAELVENDLNDFTKAMRWNKFKTAASHMRPEHRKDFIKTFVPLKDLHIVDVNIMDLQPSEDNQRLDTTIEMEYYLPPSMTVKTFSFDQTWIYFEGDDTTSRGFFISTPFPDFP